MSQIEWTEKTWNPIVGCSLASTGCAGCYAIGEAWRKMAHPNAAVAEKFAGTVEKSKAGQLLWTGRINFSEKALLEPLKRKTPTTWFVNSLSDLFHDNVSDEQIDRIFAVMALSPQHRFQVLTKRADRMRDYMLRRDRPQRIARAVLDMAITDPSLLKREPWPVQTIGDIDAPDDVLVTLPLQNLWLGVSVENQAAANERIPALLGTPAAQRFLSCEPLVGPVDLTRILIGEGDNTPELAAETGIEHIRFNINALAGVQSFRWPGLDWVICGGESGAKARPMHPDWARSLRDQCAAASVPFFFKQWGNWLPGEIFHPESARSSLLVHWLDGTDEYNGEHIDFSTETIGWYDPPGCAYEASCAKQLAVKGFIHDFEATQCAKACPRAPCREAGHCKGDDKPKWTVARNVGKSKAGRLLDRVTHDAMPGVASI